MIKNASKPKASDLLKNRVEYLFVHEESDEARQFVRKTVADTLDRFGITDPIQVEFYSQGTVGRIDFKGIDNVYSSGFEKYPRAIRSIMIKLLYGGVNYPMGFYDKHTGECVDLEKLHWE